LAAIGPVRHRAAGVAQARRCRVRRAATGSQSLGYRKLILEGFARARTREIAWRASSSVAATGAFAALARWLASACVVELLRREPGGGKQEPCAEERSPASLERAGSEQPEPQARLAKPSCACGGAEAGAARARSWAVAERLRHGAQLRQPGASPDDAQREPARRRARALADPRAAARQQHRSATSERQPE
jgi:hypothetical protein